MGSYALIPVGSGHSAKVDDEDWFRVHKAGPWELLRKPSGILYAMMSARTSEPKRMSMHRFVMGDPGGLDVDHIHHDGLDNRKAHLRVATRSQNLGNQRACGGSSRFKGVSFDPKAKSACWLASIAGEYLGRHALEVDAARAYDLAAIERWGEFALLNFPD